MDIFHVFVFRPGGVQQDNVFTSWPALVAALGTMEGRKIVEFDDSLGACQIPAGQWAMKDVSWAGFGPRPGKPRPVVDILEGAVFTGLRIIGGQITIFNKATSTSPISDFQAGDHVQIGLRDDAGNTELVNEGPAPLFNITVPVFFFVQNSILGRRSLHPLIRFTATQQPLFINLLGQNQTGNNLVRTTSGAKVVFGALSAAAQVGFDQSTIVDPDGFRYAPVGRIQRKVEPQPPAPPAISAVTPNVSTQTFTLPNALLRCNGQSPGFEQELPKIRGGFTIGVGGEVRLYSAGQEVVVAEVTGGAHLRVRPSPGDTIDGFPGNVAIGAYESRTFISDGETNWITSVLGRGSLGSARVIAITAVFETADEPDAGTNGAVYLGLGGREFRCDKVGDTFKKGATDTFVFGQFANVLNPERNDPTVPQLILSRVDRFPVYVRLGHGNTDWRFTRLTVRLTVVPGPQAPGFTSEIHHPGGLWLGSDSGAIVFLERSIEA
ncbi:MAG TPA: hypothetical protein VF424_14395 [Vicinamibacterales bacterium]